MTLGIIIVLLNFNVSVKIEKGVLVIRGQKIIID